MIDPVTAYAIGSTIAKIGSSIFGNSAEKKRAAANAARARQAYGMNVRELGDRGLQAEQSASLDKLLLGQEGEQAASTAATSAAESGVAGNSVFSLLNQYAAETSFATGMVDRNLDTTQSQLRRAKEGAFLDYQNRVASVPKPGGTSFALELAGHGLGFLGAIKGGPRSAYSGQGRGTV